MKGSIWRNPKSGTYYGRVDAGRQSNGKRRQIRLKARTRREIEDLVAQTIADVVRGTHLDPKKTTLSELLDLWLDERRSRIQYRTMADYESKIRLYLKPSLGHIVVSKLRTVHIQQAYDQWKRDQRFDAKGGARKHGTLNAPLMILSAALRYGRGLELCRENPLESVVRLSRQKAEPPEVDADYAASVLDALRGTDLYVPIWTAFACGFRRGEFLALRREHLDIEKGLLTVHEALMFRDGKRDFKAPKTPRGVRAIPLSPHLLALLRGHLQEQQLRLEMLGVKVDGRTPLFDNGFGQHWHPDAFGKAYAKAVRKAGLRPIRLGGSRHGFASIARGLVDPLVVKEMMGHENLSTTARYGRADLETRRRASIAVSDELLRRLNSHEGVGRS